MNKGLSKQAAISLDASWNTAHRAEGPVSAADPARLSSSLRSLSELPGAATGALRGKSQSGPVQLAARGLLKSYRKGPIGIPVLQGIDLEVREGEFLSVIGQSGCGKSTLLHLLGTLDQPDAGEVLFEGNRIDNLPNASRDLLRNRHFGMIFQFYHLLPELTALENVLAPAYIAEGVVGYWRRRKAYRQRATELLCLVGLEHRLKHRPREMSGGEMQRAAIARALLAQPRVLLADEPTGNLDRATGEHVMQILSRLNEQQKLTIVMVTHDAWIAQQGDRVVSLVEGRIRQA